MAARTTINALLAAARARLERIEPWPALAAAGRGGLIIDIRSEAQREAEGLVPGGYFVPRNVLEWRADPTSGYDDPALAAVAGPLILMCADGYQSSLAAATLLDLGCPRATDMVGGFTAWRAAGLPIEPGYPSHGDLTPHAPPRRDQWSASTVVSANSKVVR